MTYNVFGGTLNLAQLKKPCCFQYSSVCIDVHVLEIEETRLHVWLSRWKVHAHR